MSLTLCLLGTNPPFSQSTNQIPITKVLIKYPSPRNNVYFGDLTIFMMWEGKLVLFIKFFFWLHTQLGIGKTFPFLMFLSYFICFQRNVIMGNWNLCFACLLVWWFS